MIEDYIDTAICKNCNNLIIENEKSYCKLRTNKTGYQETDLKDNCSFFEKSTDIILAEDLLKNPDIFKIITEKEFNKTIEGEFKSRKAIFLSLCSIWIENCKIPLNTFVSSESSSGKSHTCKEIVNIFPKYLIEYRTKITPEAFTYWHNGELDWTWEGKICYLEDISQQLLDSSTFKVMCSEGSISTVVIRQKAVDIKIIGKPLILVTTAKTNPQLEIINRFQIISLDESRKQTEKIIEREAKNAEGGFQEKYSSYITKALEMLKRNKVQIPYAKRISQFIKEKHEFELSLKLRRGFSRLLSLIKCSTVLHQYQRKEENGNIIANEQDYEIARECINYIQTQTSKGLTHRLRKAFDCCLELKEFTAKEIYSSFPFVNQKSWYNILDQLLERKMLRTEPRKVEGVNQKVIFYIVNENKIFELPKFNELL